MQKFELKKQLALSGINKIGKKEEEEKKKEEKKN